MKIIVLSIALLTLSINCLAQSNMTASKVNEPLSNLTPEHRSAVEFAGGNSKHLIDNTLPNGIMLIGTKMSRVNNGVIQPLEKDVIFSNGTRVRKDGYVFRKNKYKLLLNIDEYVDASGKILPITKINSLNKP